MIILASGGGMGGGDMKLGAMLGAFLGWKAYWLRFSWRLPRRRRSRWACSLPASCGRKGPIPFGPFLALGGAAGLFYGERVVRWYFGGFAGF